MNTESQFVGAIHRIVSEENAKTYGRSLLTLLLSVALALVTTFLISRGPLALDFVVTFWLFLGSYLALKKYLGDNITRSNQYLCTAAAALSLGFILRDSPALYYLNILAMLLLCVLAFGQKRPPGIWQLALTRWFKIPLLMTKAVLSSPWLLAKSLHLPRINVAFRKDLASVLIGLLISIPFIVVFGSLLISADSRFESLVANMFRFDSSALFHWLWEYVIALWLAVGFLYLTLLHQDETIPSDTNEDRYNVEGMILITVLACISVVFLLYIVVQLSYFFGGDSLVVNTEGLTYSSYARRGFWELVWIAIIALPFVYLAHWLQRNNSLRLKRWFLRFSTVLLLSIFIIEFSALYKMSLYVNAYGLTELRLYSTAFIIFLIFAVLSLWLFILGNQTRRYLPTLLCLGISVIFTLNVINPDKLITQHNAQHTKGWFFKTKPLYHGVDAFPTIFTSAESKNLTCTDAVLFEEQLEKPENWRKWTLADWRARKAIHRWIASRCATQ